MLSAELINYSLKNLWHSRSRSFLTIFSIFIGITTIFIFISFGWGLYDYTNSFTTGSSADKIIVQARGVGAPGLDDTFKLTDDDLRTVERTSGVFEATGMYIKPAQVEQRGDLVYVFLTGYDPTKPIVLEVSNIEIEDGRQLRPGEKNSVILGYGYTIPNRIFPDTYTIGDRIKVGDEKYTVVGIMSEVGNTQDDSNIYVTNEFAEDLYPNENLSYAMIVARADIKDLSGTIERVEESLRKERDQEKGEEDFFVQSFQDLLDSFGTALNVIIGFVVLIAFISIIVSAVNTANTMVTSVLERVKEIGIMKSVGAENQEIFKIFLFESAFLGFVAGVLGTALGWAVSYTGGVILDNLGWGFLSPHFSIYLFAGCIAFATLTGAISGAWPAWEASRIKPVDALRYE